MKPTLEFITGKMLAGTLGEESELPDLTGGSILQNDLTFRLGEEDEIYEGYGRRKNAYPYRQYNCYHGEEKPAFVKTAVLENDYLRASFLPEYGGRLWSLYDKVKERNLLYTNDVIKFRNLATRNAWFSGGVEWNIGIIGHTPLTTEPLFTAELTNEKGNPILRMYEYERIRQVTYQMDFWLEEDSRFLNCRMRIENAGDEVIPMYWWSNAAVPEYEKGRLVVPAEQAYTNKGGEVYKVDIPMVDGIDVTHYGEIPRSVDYFFELSEGEPKYIANLNQEGYGLLHFSTSRLQSRKLFSWGNSDTSNRWQEFLTRNAGKYVEIQAGLGKTQYGCIPMAPHTVWEWIEEYGAIQMMGEDMQLSFEKLRKKTSEQIGRMSEYRYLEKKLKETKALAKQKAKIVYSGSGYGALKAKERPISEHLDFGRCGEELKSWEVFLETGILSEPDTKSKPDAFFLDDIYYEKLRATIGGVNGGNWYAHYQLGVMYLQRNRYHHAEKAFWDALDKKENPWTYHALAALKQLQGHLAEAVAYMKKGMVLREDSLSYQKEGFALLKSCGAYADIIQLYETQKEKFKKEGRICFIYMQALAAVGKVQEAAAILNVPGVFLLEDLREGEDALDTLWRTLHRAIYGKPGEVPHEYHFTF